jgi:hypothetical protein
VVRIVFCIGLVLVGFSVAESAWAQVPRPYDGIQAGLDAYRLAEEQRQAAVANQLATTDLMRAWSGLPPSRGQVMLYGYPAVAYPPANLDYAYAYGRPWYAPRTVFEPWPVIPGDIYGFTYIPTVRQPIGRWEGQTGPNRWESHPVYEAPQPLVTPKVVGPPLEEFPPEPPVPPTPPQPRGRVR